MACSKSYPLLDCQVPGFFGFQMNIRQTNSLSFFWSAFSSSSVFFVIFLCSVFSPSLFQKFSGFQQCLALTSAADVLSLSFALPRERALCPGFLSSCSLPEFPSGMQHVCKRLKRYWVHVQSTLCFCLRTQAAVPRGIWLLGEGVAAFAAGWEHPESRAWVVAAAPHHALCFQGCVGAAEQPGPALPFPGADVSALCLCSERRRSGCCGRRRGKAGGRSDRTDSSGAERGWQLCCSCPSRPAQLWRGRGGSRRLHRPAGPGSSASPGCSAPWVSSAFRFRLFFPQQGQHDGELVALGEGGTALAGRLGWHEQTGALLCAGRRGCLREELVEMMVVSRAERAWGCLSGIPVSPRAWHSLSSLIWAVRPGLGCCGVLLWAGVWSVSAVGLWGNTQRVSVGFQGAPAEQEGADMPSRDSAEAPAAAAGRWAGSSRSCACSSPRCGCSTSSSVGRGEGAGSRAGAGWAVLVGALALGGDSGRALGSVPLWAAAGSFSPCVSGTFNSGLKTQSDEGGALKMACVSYEGICLFSFGWGDACKVRASLVCQSQVIRVNGSVCLYAGCVRVSVLRPGRFLFPGSWKSPVLWKRSLFQPELIPLFAPAR